MQPPEDAELRLFLIFFVVFDEFDGVFNLKILYAVVTSFIVTAIILLLSAALSFYNEFAKASYVILGSTGLYILNGMACKYWSPC